MKFNQLCTLLLLTLLPTLINAQIFDSLGIVAPNASLTLVAESYSFTEGPVRDKNGDVYFTDQPNNAIHKWSAKTNEVTLVTNQAGRSNGLYIDKKGNLYGCADENNQLWRFRKDGTPEVLVKDYEGKLLNGPNDLWIHPTQGIYFTDPLYKRNYWTRNPAMQQDGEYVYRLDRKGKVHRTSAVIKKPNGIVGTPDQKGVYVADIGDSRIYRFDIAKNGDLHNRQLLAEMGADGMTVDAQGNVYLAGKGVTVFSKEGKKIAHIPVPKGWTANVCFGGTKKDILFITAGDAIFTLQMNVKGV